MTCYQLKGGIGSASRVVEVAGQSWTVGALVLANMGKLADLRWDGARVGEALQQRLQTIEQAAGDGVDKGSIIMLLATDAPLDARQLRRLALRAGAGLARTGSVFGHGSGDIALAFSTAYTLPHLPERPMPTLAMLHETRLDPLFYAAADATEHAIIHALWHAEPVRGRDGHKRRTLREILQRLPDEDTPCAS